MKVLYIYGDYKITQENFDLFEKGYRLDDLRDFAGLSDAMIIVGILSRLPFDISGNEEPPMLSFKRFPYRITLDFGRKSNEKCCYGLRIMPMPGEKLTLKLCEQTFDSNNLTINDQFVSIDSGFLDPHTCHLEIYLSNVENSESILPPKAPADYHNVA